MTKTFKVTEQQDTLEVFVELKEYSRKHDRPKAFFRTSDVTIELEKQGFKFGKEITAPEIIQNWNPKNISGTWIFEKKTLDKTPEPVIIKEEKAVQPKPKSKRRTRSSMKKVSTED